MLCLAGAVYRRAVIQPKASDTGWVVVPNLWGGMDPYTLGYLAGHSDFSTTRRYVHPQVQTVRDAIERARNGQAGANASATGTGTAHSG